MKKFLTVCGVCFIIVLAGWLNGLRFTEAAAVSSSMHQPIQKIDSVETEDGKAVLFESQSTDQFGIARLKKYIGFLYKYEGASYAHFSEEKPFVSIGFAGQENYLTAIKTAESSNIAHVSLGNHTDKIMPSGSDTLSLEDVEKNSDKYHLKKVKDSYALFAVDEYTEDSATIRAFNQKGNLIAVEIANGDAGWYKGMED